MSLHLNTAGYIYNEVLRNTRYLVLSVDARGVVTEQDCPGAGWTVAGVRVGRPLPETLRAVVLSTPIEQRTQLYPYIYLGEDLVVDVHVLSRDGQRQLILQDVSEAHDAELKLQQKAHEVSLLLEKQAELNRELDLQRAEAERASQAKSRFIAAMSHEFRTPIQSIMGHAELLSGQVAETRLPAAIQRASWHLLTLVENLLEQARQGEGIVQLSPGPVDVAAMLSDMRELFAQQAAARGLELQVHGPDTPLVIETDELRLRQVLIKLLSNALRYTPQGRVELSAEATRDGVEFSVRDTGPGIEERDRERIFKPFSRLDPDRETGAGLGLTISRQLVGAMGGELALESEMGRGSVFSFVLPAGRAGRGGSSATLQGARVLLVDDDPDVLDLYAILMGDWGLQVHAASSLGQALDAAGEQSFEMVVTDLQLGDGSGLDLLTRLRESQPGCRTILVSGSALADADCTLADTVLMKPVQPGRLAKR